MKKYFFIVIFVFTAFLAHSQVLITLLLGKYLNTDKLKFGLEGGMNWANITGMESSDYARYFNLGFYFDIQMKDQLRLYTGTLVKSNLGLDKLSTSDLEFLQSDIYEQEGNYRQVSNTFLVPAYLKYDFRNHFYVMAGPQFGLLHKAYVEFTREEGGIDARIRQNNKDMFHKIDAGIGAGLGYTLMKGEGIMLGFKYYHGFTDVYKDKSGTKNNSFNIMACLRIGKPITKKPVE